MSTPASRLPLNLGRPVQHRSDPTKAVGILLGWIFNPPLGALVRWQDGAATFEDRKDIRDLLDVIGIPAAVSAPDQIRRRIERGILPLTAPVKAGFARLAQWQPCDGCDELIAPRQVAWALEYREPRRVVRLHGACHRLWEAECRRRGQPALVSTEPRSPGDVVGCALCQRPIEARQNIVFRRDGRVEHVTCVEPSRKPWPVSSPRRRRIPCARHARSRSGQPIAWPRTVSISPTSAAWSGARSLAPRPCRRGR